MASVTINILSVFLIISMLNYGILSVFIEDIYDTEPSTCEFNEDCPDDQKCSNNLCVDACEEVECSLNQRCVTGRQHTGQCECRKTYAKKPNVCIPSCQDDSDCDSSRECKPDNDEFYQCLCRPEFAPDPVFPEHECRLKCKDDDDCNMAGSFCKKGLCFAFCDNRNCEYPKQQCLIVGEKYLCLQNNTISMLYY